MNSLKENGMKFRRWRPEEPAIFILAAPAEDKFEMSNFAFFASDWGFFGAANMSMSVRCRFKGFEAGAEALELSCEALGVVDASRVDDAAVLTSAR